MHSIHKQLPLRLETFLSACLDFDTFSSISALPIFTSVVQRFLSLSHWRGECVQYQRNSAPPTGIYTSGAIVRVQTSGQTENTRLYLYAGVTDIKCYGVYGCFPLNGVWISNNRQLNMHPESPSKVNPRFPLFTKNNPEEPYFIDINEPDSVRSFGINPKGKLFLISHGYLEAGDRPWLRVMTNTLLSNDPDGTASVIIVDWGAGSSPPYAQAVANIRLVGAIVGHIVNLVYEETGMENLDKVHFIGHSLGSHIAGYAGYTLQKYFGLKLGRITGLDPAEPLFGETDPIVRLDRTDAKYVDIIHSDAISPGGLGMIKPIGHVDFYPNGGHDNPGCTMSLHDHLNNANNSIFWSLQDFVGCNHVRSYQFFTESIYTRCPFTAISCDSYEDFQNGECFSCEDRFCLKFGYDSLKGYNELKKEGYTSDDASLVTYLMTSAAKPFCRVHYRVTVKMSATEESALHGGEIGTLSLRFQSHRRKETEKMSFYPEPFFFEPGMIYTSVVGGADIGETLQARASWDYETNFLNPLTWRILASPRIYIDYLIVESLEHKTIIKLCPVHQSPIIAGSPTILHSKYCTEE